MKSPRTVLRGGGWFDDARLIRASYRSRIETGDRDYNIGFRAGGMGAPMR
jgi:formylglycine-generating enzyme required for sulfatase activity